MFPFQLPHKIGIDFDNTLIDYSNVFHYYAQKHFHLDANTVKEKNVIRNKIRELDEGENKWQKLQALIYGPHICDAERFKGTLHFFRRCQKNKITLYIISHKTIFATKDETQTNLRHAALDWMANNNFFQYISKQNIFFESTREAKIRRISQLNCDVFIDDLEEIFFENDFPNNVRKLLFIPNKKKKTTMDIEAAQSWDEISNLIFY